MGSIVFTMLSNANISSNRTRCSKHFFLLSQNHHVRTPLQQQLTHTLGKLDSQCVLYSQRKKAEQHHVKVCEGQIAAHNFHDAPAIFNLKSGTLFD